MDREKVIKGLHQHCEGSLFDRCGECPYYETDYGSWGENKFKCRDELLEDVHALLKEQGPVIPKHEKEAHWIKKSGDALYCSNCDAPSINKQPYCYRCGSRMI